MAKFYMMAKYTPEALKGFMSKPEDSLTNRSYLLSFDIVRDYDLVCLLILIQRRVQKLLYNLWYGN